MPHRARTREALVSGHPLLHKRDDRAIEVGRKKIEHPKDRRKSVKKYDYYDPCTFPLSLPQLAKPRLTRSEGDNRWQGFHPDAENNHRGGGLPTHMMSHDLPYWDAYSDGGDFYPYPDTEVRGQPNLDLWEMAKPERRRGTYPPFPSSHQRTRSSKRRTDRRAGFEMISRPAPVVALEDESEEEWDDFELVERMPAPGAKKSGKAKKTFAQIVQRTRRSR